MNFFTTYCKNSSGGQDYKKALYTKIINEQSQNLKNQMRIPDDLATSKAKVVVSEQNGRDVRFSSRRSIAQTVSGFLVLKNPSIALLVFWAAKNWVFNISEQVFHGLP